MIRSSPEKRGQLGSEMYSSSRLLIASSAVSQAFCSISSCLLRLESGSPRKGLECRYDSIPLCFMGFVRYDRKRQMDFSGFDDPGFDADAWLNSKLNSDGKIDEIENQVNQILARLQMRSRDISQATDQGIKAIYSELPQAMARMSQIGSMVGDVAEAIRDLTNSGYKFKSGNIPDKISELSSLKVRRDRLKEASEKLKNGIEFENQLVELRNSAGGGDLKSVCAQFQEVEEAYQTLKSIPKFESLRSDLLQMQQIIEKRLRPEMATACSKLNAPTFSRYAEYAKQIQMEMLPSSIVLEHFREKILGVLRNFDEGELPITVWLQQCLEQCHEQVIRVSQWCLSLKPAIFVTSIRLDFIQIVSQVVGPSIDKRSQSLLSSLSFDDLVVIVNAVNHFALSFPLDWNVKQEIVFGRSLEYIQSHFPEVLQKHLNSKVTPARTIPKSSTTGALNRSPAPSPSRSTERFSAAERAQPFDKTKLSGCIDLAVKTQEWIKALSKDPIKCVKLVSKFLEDAIALAVSELNGSAGDTASLSDAAYILKFAEILQLYVFELRQEQKLQGFLREADKIGLTTTTETGGAFEKLKIAIEDEIVNVMTSKPIAALVNLRRSPEWASVSDADPYDRMYDAQPSKYLGVISQHFLALIRSLSETDGLNDALRRKWMSAAANRVIDYYVREIISIPRISEQGRQQLERDVMHMKEIFAALDLATDDRLAGIQAVLEAGPGKRTDVALASEIKTALERAMKS